MLQEDMGVAKVLRAVRFSAEKHRDQRRKDPESSPYINHPIEVAETLWREGEVRDIDVIIAAILHDTLEDTKTTPEEIEEQFGRRVREMVEEVTDDKSLPKHERKRLQVEHAPALSAGAKQIKLGDKAANVRDVAFSAPPDWDFNRRSEYLAWADSVVERLRGCNSKLEAFYDSVMTEARRKLESEQK